MGLRSRGVEVFPEKSVRYIRRRLAGDRLKGKQFDLVTIWHVLEHVRDPEAYIERIYRLLKDKGRLVIEVPNFDSHQEVQRNTGWARLKIPPLFF